MDLEQAPRGHCNTSKGHQSYLGKCQRLQRYLCFYLLGQLSWQSLFLQLPMWQQEDSGDRNKEAEFNLVLKLSSWIDLWRRCSWFNCRLFLKGIFKTRRTKPIETLFGEIYKIQTLQQGFSPSCTWRVTGTVEYIREAVKSSHFQGKVATVLPVPSTVVQGQSCLSLWSKTISQESTAKPQEVRHLQKPEPAECSNAGLSNHSLRSESVLLRAA